MCCKPHFRHWRLLMLIMYGIELVEWYQKAWKTNVKCAFTLDYVRMYLCRLRFISCCTVLEYRAREWNIRMQTPYALYCLQPVCFFLFTSPVCIWTRITCVCVCMTSRRRYHCTQDTHKKTMLTCLFSVAYCSSSWKSHSNSHVIIYCTH